MDQALQEHRRNPIFVDTADIPETPEPVELEIDGTVPGELSGILYRNGPVRFEGGGFAAQHPFDGDGLVCRYRLDGGRITFRSRYVRTRKFTQIQNGRGADVKGIGNRLPGWWRNLRLPADSANTQAMFHAGRLLALSDAGKPWELDPHTLTTIGACSLDGALSRIGRYSPHPRVDATTGELFNFGIDVVPRLLPKLPLGLRCYRTSPDGHTRSIATIPLDGAHIQHDFAITEKFLVFLISPITVDPWKALTQPQELAAQWHRDKPTRVILVPRNGGQMAEYTLDEPLAYVHIVNAYQDDLGVHVDLVRFPDPDDFFVPTRQFRTSTRAVGGCTTRVTIAPSGTISLRDINARRYELPQYDWRRAGLPYTYGYYTTLRSTPETPNEIYKVDHTTGTEQRLQFAPGDVPGEPFFVPRTDAVAEDDGWLLTQVTSGGCTSLHIIDARNIHDGPVATAAGPTGFFPGFHGSFTRTRPGDRTPR